MGKIAALVLPLAREKDLEAMAGNLKRALSFVPQHVVEERVYRGRETVCMLLRVKPDVINASTQPVTTDAWAGVMCGYYMTGTEGNPGERRVNEDPAQRLLGDIGQNGVEALTQGDGVYTFLRWDFQSESLIAGVDKLGMRPLYWSKLSCGGFVAASELKAVISLIEQPKPNWLAWEEKLAFSFVFGNHTLIEDVSRLGPAEICRFAQREVSLTTLENFLESIEIVPRSVEAFLEEQETLFDTSMTQLTSLFPASKQSMLTLSGGYDSRRILAWLLQENIAPEIYTVPEVLADGREYQSGLVRELCVHAGLQGWHVYPETPDERGEVTKLRDLLTDFQSDDHFFTTMLAMSLECFDKVNFDGLAAGVALGGVFVRNEYLGENGNDKFMAAWPTAIDPWLVKSGNASGLFARVRSHLEAWGDNPNRFSYFYLLSRTRCKVGLAPLAFQANVFESLYPYLSRGMMRSAFSFPVEDKIDAHLQRALIKRFNTPLSEVPTSHDPLDSIGSEYFTQMGEIERQEKLRLLKSMLKIRGSMGPWKTPAKQRLRFTAAYGMRERIGRGLFNWEAGKAGRINQLSHFWSVAQSGSGYLEAMDSLNGVFGSRPQWRRPLNTMRDGK